MNLLKYLKLDFNLYPNFLEIKKVVEKETEELKTLTQDPIKGPNSMPERTEN